jgi:hypothetical protein
MEIFCHEKMKSQQGIQIYTLFLQYHTGNKRYQVNDKQVFGYDGNVTHTVIIFENSCLQADCLQACTIALAAQKYEKNH